MTKRNWKVVFEAKRCPVKFSGKCAFDMKECATEEKDCPARMFSQFKGDEPEVLKAIIRNCEKRLEIGRKEYGDLDVGEKDCLREAREEGLDLMIYIGMEDVKIGKEIDRLTEEKTND